MTPVFAKHRLRAMGHSFAVTDIEIVSRAGEPPDKKESPPCINCSLLPFAAMMVLPCAVATMSGKDETEAYRVMVRPNRAWQPRVLRSAASPSSFALAA
jgi:hypothetical protein